LLQYQPFGKTFTFAEKCHFRSYQRCEMKKSTFIYGATRSSSSIGEAVESLRLLKAFLKLAPRERFEVIELVERLATKARPPPTTRYLTRAVQAPFRIVAGGRVAIA